MTAQELIAHLETYPGDAPVSLSRDEEGNGYKPLADVEYSPTDSDGEPCHPDDAEDDAPRVVVLWP